MKDMDKNDDIKLDGAEDNIKIDDTEIKDIDLDDYAGIVENTDEEGQDEDDEGDDDEGKDEDFSEVGGRLKKTGPYLLGGLLTIVLIIVIGCVIAFFAGKKKTDETGGDVISVSTNDASTAANPSGNDLILIEVSGNNAQATDSVGTETDAASSDESSTGEGLIAGDTTTTGSIATLSRTFLDSEDYENVTNLIEEYFVAYEACNLKKILQLVDYNGGTQITQNELDERAEIVEGYQELEFYIIEGMDVDSYVVYTSYGIKFFNIDTLAPTLTRFYVTTSDDGSLHIYNGEVTSKLNAYLNTVDDYDCVNELSESINEALEKACEADETLKALMEILYGV